MRQDGRTSNSGQRRRVLEGATGQTPAHSLISSPVSNTGGLNDSYTNRGSRSLKVSRLRATLSPGALLLELPGGVGGGHSRGARRTHHSRRSAASAVPLSPAADGAAVASSRLAGSARHFTRALTSSSFPECARAASAASDTMEQAGPRAQVRRRSGGSPRRFPPVTHKLTRKKQPFRKKKFICKRPRERGPMFGPRRFAGSAFPGGSARS